MNININSFSFISIFRQNVLPSLTAQQKKIIMIVSIAFGLLSASYLIILCYFKLKQVKCYVNQLPEKEIDEKENLNKKVKNLIFDEIFKTEKTYKTGLENIARLKEIYLEKKDEWLKMVKSDERRHLKACFEQLFEIIDQLRDLSDMIFEDVEGLNGESSDQEFSLQFGKFFNKFEHADFTLFGKFATIHNEMTRILDVNHAKDQNSTLQNEINRVFTEQIDEGNDFDDIMITPIQRMPRYQLLLIELRKRTPDGSTQAENLDHLIHIATQANLSNNDQLKANDLKNRVLIDSQKRPLKHTNLLHYLKRAKQSFSAIKIGD